jgi:WD40 repeat protein
MIKIYNESLSLTQSFQAHTGAISRMKVLPNGLVATVSNDKTAILWNLLNNGSWIMFRKYTRHTDKVIGLEYIDTFTMATGSNDNTIQIWSIKKIQQIKLIYTGYNVFALKSLRNGSYLASAFQGGLLYIYDINTGGLITSLIGHSGNVNELELINDDLLASAGDDNTVRIWDLKTYTNKFILTGHTDKVFGLKLVSSNLLASVSKDTTIKLWNITSEALIRTVTGHTSEIRYYVDMFNDGQTLVSGSYDLSIKLWNVNSGLCSNTISTGLKTYSLAVLNSTLTSKKNKILYPFPSQIITSAQFHRAIKSNMTAVNLFKQPLIFKRKLQ